MNNKKCSSKQLKKLKKMKNGTKTNETIKTN